MKFSGCDVTNDTQELTISQSRTQKENHFRAVVFNVRIVETRTDVYETLCPQQMLVHKGSQIKSWGGVCRKYCSVKIFKEHCRYFPKNNYKEINK